MSALALIFGPAVAGVGLGLGRVRAALALVVVALTVTGLAWWESASSTGPHLVSPYLRLDPTAKLFLAFVNPIFLGVSTYVWSRINAAPVLAREMRRFVPSTLLFLAATNAVFVANHLLLMWLALETTTLMIAPLIVRRGHRRSLLASWRYLLFSSVGLALVLLGILCIERSFEAAGAAPELFLDRLGNAAAATDDVWGKLGVSLMLLGLGTKLGLAPMYTWLPEAYDEAPPSVTALLGGVQFNAALVALFRVVQVFRATHASLIATELITLGLISMAVSTTGIVATRNIKRLVAYASINHAGVIAIGLGLGRDAAYGLLLYVISNAFIKTILFLTVGKIKAHFGTKDSRQLAGLLRKMPYSGVFLMIGTFALLGFPPFGSFFGELLILSALVSANRMTAFAAFCVLISVTFVATGRTVFPMIWGEPKLHFAPVAQSLLSALPKMFFLAGLVALGLYIPPGINALILSVAQSLGAP